MVKIKRKVEMTLPELIEWGLENGIKSRRFTSNRLSSKHVGFDTLGGVCFNSLYSYLLEDTFTVEVEEEITEETKHPKFLEISFDRKSGGDFAVVRENQSIKNIVDKNVEHFIDTRTIHLFNDDGTHTLIWKYGELVGDE
ncbi:hypothetical protein BUY49_11520 [Staphylococcus devriesei]|uniref:hypothetical protein n=1 Tax=Staphylococcus devriesei TaxID=586733 RepID=UPI000E6A8E88|nr:hypothetical protein [Staphylococcus devriesei]RIL69144.1 hypothetical protein BUY49_11520 [Staphylococcus devriesei]